MAQINLPRSGGGLVSYSEEYKSKIRFPPIILVVLIVAVIIMEYALHKFF